MKPSASFADPVFVAGNPKLPWSVYDDAPHEPPTRPRIAVASRNTSTVASQDTWFVAVDTTPVTLTCPAAAVACQ